MGFVTFGAEGEAGDALDSKIKGMTRASVSSAPAISQALVLEALKDPDLAQQKADLLTTCQARYRTLKDSLADAGINAAPFNSGFFAMIPVPGDPEALRLRLLEQGVGIISLPKHGAIRIAYSSTSEDDIPAMVNAIAAQLKVSA